MAIRLEGKALAAKIKEDVIAGVHRLKEKGIEPCLAVVAVGESTAGELYIKGKKKDCAECGVILRECRLPDECAQAELLREIGILAADSTVHGILVQLPLPKGIDEAAVIAAVPPEKDVDGLSPINVGRMVIGEPCFLPCTAAACLEMVRAAGENIQGKKAVVIGRSNIVGKPAALLLLRENATVTICHSRTKDLRKVCENADILVSAVGKAGLVTGDMVKPGAIVVDAGINRNTEGKTCGDVVFGEAEKKAAYITPVPGGVGLVTRAVLMRNVVQAACVK